MHSDAAVIPGTRHARVGEPAQDFAIHRDASGVSWGIASDGCSSAGRTDLGARLWSLALDDVLNTLSTHQGPNLTWMEATEDQAFCVDILREILPALPRGAVADDLQATIVMAVGTSERAVGIIAGDGALLALYADGEIELVEHRFTGNLPAYPAYLGSPEATARFIDQSKRIQQVLEVRRTLYAVSGEILLAEVTKIDIDETLAFACQQYDFSASLRPLAREDALVALFAVTDGLATRPRTKLSATLTDLCTFHNLAGSFLRRRVGWLSGQWAAQRTLPQDDLSVAGVCWPPVPNLLPLEGA